MLAKIITPYVEHTTDGVTALWPLVRTLFDCRLRRDMTARDNGNVTPETNLYLVEVEISRNQLSKVKSDDRFFVLEPGPGYNGNALQTWLNSKGATDNPVTGNETAEEAISKLRVYFKRL